MAAVVLGIGVGAVASSCDAPTFWCLDDLTVGDGEWTCVCKATSQTCDDLGDCMSECPL